MAVEAILRLVARAVPTGLALPVFRGPLRGSRWISGAAAGEGKGLSVLLNLAEPSQLAAAVGLASPNAVFFDVGANVGLYTLLMAKRCRTVFAFEPVARNIAYLHRTIESNALANVTVVPCAMARQLGTAVFALGTNVATGRIDDAGTLPVVTVSCDTFVKAFGILPTILKIDVEGAELDVLLGAEETLRSKPSILLSVHSPDLRHACLHLLSGKGYAHIVPLDTSDDATATEFAVTA